MPSKKEIENAWDAHDQSGEKDCVKRPGWNKTLGHSRFNPGCKAWVMEYAKAHPISRKAGPPPKERIIVKHKCARCRKTKKEKRMLKFEMMHIPDDIVNEILMNEAKKRGGSIPTEKFMELKEKVSAEHRINIRAWVCSKRCGRMLGERIKREGVTEALRNTVGVEIEEKDPEITLNNNYTHRGD